MNNLNNIETLFKKLVDNQLSKAEYNALITLIKDASSKERVKQLLDQHLQSDTVLQKHSSISERNAEDVEKLYMRVMHKIDGKQKVSQCKTRNFLYRQITSLNFYKTAAVMLLLIGVFFINQHDAVTVKDEVASIPAHDDGDITLKLANGDVMIISGNGQNRVLSPNSRLVVSQNGGRLNYTKKEGFNEVEYNELNIPNGKQFDLVLTDGTRVTLNAGSWIKYPVQFNAGSDRTVYLKGEAYFDVAKDKAHPFIVHTGGINVEVLGTQFNLSNYPEDAHINTVLVEGSVKVYEESKKDIKSEALVLTPGHLAAWHAKTMAMTVEAVDVSLYTDWRNGILKLKNAPFHTIRKQLERHFDVRIENHNEFLEQQIYTATFKEENIVDILNAFKEDTPFEYEMVNNTITIKSN